MQNERYEFRGIRPGEAAAAVAVEQACFPVSEACTLPIMEQRVQRAPELFYAAIDRENGKLIGFITAIAVNERHLRDEFFTNTSLHCADGVYVMILSLAVHPDYRKQGIARELMRCLVSSQFGKRDGAVLTCVERNVELYKKFGYQDLGISDSTWGGEEWHEMICPLR